MKKLLALLMAVAVTFQLVTPVFADTEGTEETTAPTEAVVETEAPTEAPAEETTAPTEETAAPTEETFAPTEATEETEEATEATEETVEDIALFADDGDVIASGECGKNGDNLKWVLTTDGTLTISGSGEMKYYTDSPGVPWYSERDKILSVVVEHGVTGISGNAFSYCSSLTSAEIPEGVTSIGSWAFFRCSRLTSVTIPEGVTSIGDGAFYGCSSLTSVTIPEGVTSIGEYAFYDCSSLTSAEIPEGVTSIGEYAFYGCSGLTSVTIPESVTSIGSYAFSGCSSLTSVTIPKGVTSVGDAAFECCSSLTSVTILDGVTSIGGAAFSVCRNLSSVTIPNSVTYIGDYAFCDCSSLTSVTIPEGVARIDDGAFYGCSSLTSVTIPEGVTSIERKAFEGCGSLTYMVIPDGVTSIGSSAFEGCSNLTSVTIPESVTDIGNFAFYGCSSLTSVTIPKGMGYIDGDTFSGCSNLTSVTIPESVTIIGDNAFRSCSKLKHVYYGGPDQQWKEIEIGVNNDALTNATIHYGTHIHDMVKTEAVEPTYWNVGNNAYYTCSRCGKAFKDANGETETTVEDETLAVLPSIAHGTCGDDLTWALTEDGTLTISGSGNMNDYRSYSIVPWRSNRTKILSAVVEPGVTSVGGYAFYGCSNLTSVTIPDGVISIGQRAFSGCSGLTSVTIPDSVTSIGEGVFSGCSGLTSVTIPDSVTSIGDAAFSGCSGLTNVTIPESVTSIGDAAFEDCSKLTSMTIPEGVTSIGSAAFEGCSSLTSVAIPEGVTSIGDAAFSGCSSLTSVTIPDGITSIGELAFKGCSSLTGVTIPDGVISIGNAAFEDCSSLTSIAIPDGVTSIDDWAFYGCSSLTSVAIPKGVTSIGSYAFYGCSSLASVTIPDGVTSIGELAFYDCSSLSSVIIPDSVTSIGDDAFRSCSKLEHVYYGGPDAQWKEIEVGYGNGALTGATIHYSSTHIHNTEHISGKAASCTETGNLEYWRCLICGEYFTDEDCTQNADEANVILPALGHTMTKTERAEPTCTTGGSNVYYTCSVCNKVFKDADGKTETTAEAEILPALDHDMVKTEAVEPTYWSVGNNAYYTCSRCGKVYKDANGETETTVEDETLDVLPSIAHGTCGDNLTWVLTEDGTLTISGSGKMKNYSSSSLAPWYSNRTKILSVVVEPGVTSVGAYAFCACLKLTSVTLHGDVKSIDGYAFQDCTKLAAVEIPEGVTGIGYRTFAGCGGLTSVTIPESVTSIGDGAFYGCSSLTSVTIPERVTSIGNDAFRGCSSLTSMTIPDGVTSVGDYVFYECSGLISVMIPEKGVTGIGNYAFAYCRSLTSVTIPESVTSIDVGAFHGCSGLTSVTIPEGVASISSFVFENCSGLTSVTIPDGVVNIDQRAFSGCSSLASVTIPDGVTSIGGGAFSGCSNLEHVYYGGSDQQWKEIEIGVSNDALTNAIIHYGSTHIHDMVKTEAVEPTYWTVGNNAYYTCSRCGKVFKDANGETETTVEDETLAMLPSIAHGTCGIMGDNLTWVLTGDGTLTISGSGEMAYYSMDNSRRTTAPWAAYWEQITAIVLEPGVTSVGWTAFSACSNVLSVSIPSTVTHIDGYAFEECENMTDITFGHKFDDSLRIDESSFDSACRLARTIRVPSARKINKTIETYRWDRSCKSVNYVSTENIPMEGITIENSESIASVELGTQVELQVSLNPIDTTDDYTWTVVSEKATADARISKDGVLTTLSTGTVTVRVQCVQNPAVFDEIVVTILPPTGTLTGLAVTTLNDYPGDAELGKPVQMIPVFTPANASERSVTWSLENGTGTATIDENGLLTPLTTGTVMVYATTPSGIEGGCTVNIVRYAEEITILLNGKEDLSRFAAGEGAELSFRLSPEDTTTKEVEWKVINETGAAKLCIDSGHEYAKLECQKAGSVTLTATAKDSKQVVATKELTITDSVCTYALPDGSGNLYYNAETGWITGADETVKNVLIPAKIDGVTIVGIDPYVFANRDDYFGYVNDNTTLASVSIPNTMEEIGENAFMRCTALSTLRFAPGSKLKAIGEYAFQGCSSITSLTIPDGVKNIGNGAFYGLSNLKNLTMSGEMDGSGWIGWWSLDTLTLTGTYVLGGTSTDEDDYRWYNALPGRNARKVVLSEGITSIGEYAFYECQNLEQIVLPQSLQVIGAHAFEECWNLADVTMPDSLQTLGQDCFKDCKKLQLIDMSKVPDTFIERQTCLTGMVTFPDWLVRATKGKAEIDWDLYQEKTDYVTRYPDFASVDKRWNTQQWYLYAYGSGKCYIVCQDTYTGIRGSKEIEVKTGVVIRPADTGYLVSGGKLALSAWNVPAESRADADWSLAPGSEEYASIDYRGNLTAKTVYAAQQITVIAQPYDGGERVTKNIWILPKTTGLGLMLDGAPLGSTLNVDQAQTETLQLSAKVYPDGALQEMQWTSTASGVARVDEDGLVTLVKPGVTVIKAATKDGSRLTAQVTLNVTYVDSAGKLTLTAGEMPEIGLQPGQKVRLTLRGEQAIPYESVVFSVPSNQSAMGSVDENGLFTAGKLTGRVDVTAALKDDPLGRTANIAIQVIPVQAAELALTAELPEENLLDGTVIFDRTELNRDVIFPVTAKAFDRQGVEVVKDILWSSSDDSVAKVDFEGNVTVKAGANGYCAITATAQDLAMASATILISVRDYAPRLGASTLNLNTASTAGLRVELVESYGNAIEKVTVDDARFCVSYEDNLLTLTAREAVARGNYSMTLEAVCDDGRTYSYPITVRVTQTLPKLTVKQNQKFNLFYRDSQAALTITGGEVESAELTGNSDFVLKNEDGEWVIRYADPANVPEKPGTKATLCVSFAGYNTPVTKALTIGTVNTAPKLALNPASSTLNTALNSDWSVETVLSGADGENLCACTDTPGVDVELSGNVLTLTLTEAKNVSANVCVQDDNWTKPVKLTHRITVTSKLPTLKAAAGTLKLNSWFPSETASTGMILSQGNVSLNNVELTPAAKAGTAARAESDKLNVYYDADSGEIVAEITDPSIKNGTYSFTCTGILESGTEIPGGTVRVTVSNTLPKAKLSASVVKLNRRLAGDESIAVKVTLTGGDGYTIEGFEELPDCLDYADGILTATLPDADFTGGSYVLNAIVSRNGEAVTLPAGVSLKVQVYDKAPSFRLTAKGKLDVLNPASEIVYTPRLTNAQGAVTDIRLEGADAELFMAEVVDGAVHLTMAEGCTYSTRTTYKVIPVLTFCGQEVTGSALSIRVTQSALRLAALPNRTVYQSQTVPLVQVLSITSPTTAEIGEITLNSRSTAALWNAVEAAGGIEVSGGTVRFPAKAFASLKPGRYTVILDVTPENAAADAKPIQARFTLTVQK